MKLYIVKLESVDTRSFSEKLKGVYYSHEKFIKIGIGNIGSFGSYVVTCIYYHDEVDEFKTTDLERYTPANKFVGSTMCHPMEALKNIDLKLLA